MKSKTRIIIKRACGVALVAFVLSQFVIMLINLGFLNDVMIAAGVILGLWGLFELVMWLFTSE